jgi:hypothetical protein
MALGDNLSGDQRNAFEAVNNLFSSYGLQSLAPKIYSYIQNGYSADTVSILLQDSDEYKQRFAGNEVRKQKGLPVLSPAQYLATEDNYRQTMQQAGLPQGFYDQPSDFNDFIGKDVSPTELKSRVDLASQATTLANPNYKRALQQMYGLDDSNITAYFLDEDKALPLLQKQASAAAIGAEALKRGLTASPYSEAYATAGVTASQAATAYGQIAMQLPQYSQFSHLYGENVTQTDFERALLENNTTGNQAEEGFMAESPQAKLDRLASFNRARQEGKAGGAAGGLARTDINV